MCVRACVCVRALVCVRACVRVRVCLCVTGYSNFQTNSPTYLKVVSFIFVTLVSFSTCYVKTCLEKTIAPLSGQGT